MANSTSAATNDEVLFELDGDAVMMTDISANLFDDAIRSYAAPPHLAYKFNNPGFALVAQRPNPDIDPARVDTTGEIWMWRKGMPYIFWERLHVIQPLKELIKEFAFHKIQRVAYTTAANVVLELFEIQDRLKDPSAYPWSQEKILMFLAGLRMQYDHFYAFKEFYRWATANGKPGFDEEIAWRIRNARTSRSDEFVEYAGVKQRKHVLSFEEDRAIRKALEYKPSAIKLPTLTDPERRYTLEEVAYWFGAWPMEPGAAKADNTSLHNALKSYRALLKFISVPSTPVPLAKREASITGYVARVNYRAGGLLPALRSFIVRGELIALRSNIMTHLAYALGPRPSQIIGIDEDSFVKYDPDGEAFYAIDIPSRKKRTTATVKRRNSGGKPRVLKVSKRRKFPEEIGLGQKIEAYISLKREAEVLGVLTKPKTGKYPLFISDCREAVLSGERPTEQDATSAIGNFLLKQYGIKRTAKDLRANVAQRLADAGYAAEVIAETLDHENTKNVKHYVKASLKLSEIQDIALAEHEGYKIRMDKLRGSITINKSDINADTDVISGVVGGVLVSGIGACERKCKGMDPCANEPVYSCYGGCPAFVPFDEIDVHKRVLDALKAEVIEHLEMADEDDEPIRMALTSQNLIADVAAIIQIIEERSA